MSFEPKAVARLFGGRWYERHGDSASGPDAIMFRNRVEVAVIDAIEDDASIDFAVLLALDEETDDYGTALLLSGRRLLTVRVANGNTVFVTYLGELVGGLYAEEVTIPDDFVTARRIRYEHPRLRKQGPIEFEFEVNRATNEPVAPLRALLREWSTAAPTT